MDTNAKSKFILFPRLDLLICDIPCCLPRNHRGHPTVRRAEEQPGPPDPPLGLKQENCRPDWELELQSGHQHHQLWHPRDQSQRSGGGFIKTKMINVAVTGIPSLMVVTIQEPPYVMLKCPDCSGNDRYEGFAIDLLNRISQAGKISSPECSQESF